MSHNRCNKCGVLRASAWFAKGPGKRGLQARCRPCHRLRDLELKETHKKHRETQIPITEKRCSACEKTLPASHFNKRSGTKDGHQSGCRACSRIQKSAWGMERTKRSKNGTLVFAIGKERICSVCNTCKPWTEFTIATQNNYGIRSCCKQCNANNSRLQRSRIVISDQHEDRIGNEILDSTVV